MDSFDVARGVVWRLFNVDQIWCGLDDSRVLSLTSSVHHDDCSSWPVMVGLCVDTKNDLRGIIFSFAGEVA
jgi:hypothetical protein